MSGIAGIICLGSCSDGSHRESVDRICTLLRHRGPNGMEIAAAETACLGVAEGRPLASPGENVQPVRSEDGNLLLVFDGAIYNAKDLRAELEQEGRPLRSGADAEVVLRAFEAWGEKALGRFHGPFAFALHDRRAKTTTLVRDHYGTRPIHYAIHDGHLVFASEIKALLSAVPNRGPNKRAVLEWLLHGDVVPPETMFEGIYAISPGHLIEARAGEGRPRPRRYYNLVDHVDRAAYERFARIPFPELVREVDAALVRGVGNCLEGAGPIGAMLSGGIDSNVVTAFAREQREIVAVHASVGDDASVDERPAAERLAKHVKVPFLVCTVNGSNFREDLARITYWNEMPIWHLHHLPFNMIARKASEEGIKLLVCGTMIGISFGPDVGRHLAAGWMYRARRIFGRLSEKYILAVEKTVLAHREAPISGPGVVHKYVHMTEFADGWARNALLRECEEAYSFVSDPAARSTHAMMLADHLQFAYRFHHRADRLAMSYSVEHRNAFHDAPSVHMVINIPFNLKVHGHTTKWVLKQAALGHLPRDLVFVPKGPWALPTVAYLASVADPELFRDGFCSEYFRLEPSAVRRLAADVRRAPLPFFSLLAVEIWGRLFFMGETPDQVTERVLRAKSIVA